MFNINLYAISINHCLKQRWSHIKMSGLLTYSRDEIIQDLTLTRKDHNLISLEYLPSHEKRKRSILSNEDKQKKSLSFELIRINIENNSICIYPICLRSSSTNFLRNKYLSIQSITLRGEQILKSLIKCDDKGEYRLPEKVSDMLDIIKKLPRGFIKDYQYGLGFFKECRFIISKIEELSDVKYLIISSDEETHIDQDSYILKYAEFKSIRNGLENISRQHQKNARVQKNTFAYNKIITVFDDAEYLEMQQPYVKDTIYKLIPSCLGSPPLLSERDAEAVFDVVSNDAENYFDKYREKSVELQQQIESLNIKRLIDEMEKLLEKSSNEQLWQKLLSDNPFILSLAFGYPIVKIQEQASVGGRKINGSGDKITDFLVKNHLTHNVALVEIKTPSTQLLQTKEYRGGVHAASSDLSGSINQILDQKYKFQTEINNRKLESKIYDMESYSIDCVLIIGRIPKEDAQKKCFELFRHNSKDVKIITFDELLGRMQEIHSFLSPVCSEPDFDDIPF